MNTAKLDRHLRAYVDHGRVAGISAFISRADAPVYEALLGWRDRESRAPMTLDTIVRLYSLSKPVTAVAALMLVEAGQLQLDEPISHHLPEFRAMKVHSPSGLVPAVRDITPRDLLTHTAGFGYGEGEHPVDRLYVANELFGGGKEPVAAMTRKLATLPLKHQPGERFEYSVAYDVLGRLIEVAARQSFGDFLEQRIFSPLGMRDTGFGVAPANVARFAALYGAASDGTLTLLESPAAERFRPPVRFEAGGQGLVSTRPDFLRFLRMLKQGGTLDGVRILAPATIEQMRKPLPRALMQDFWMKGHSYGLGVGVLVDPAPYGAGGAHGTYTWAGSASTYFWVDPVNELIALLFLQFEPSSALPIATEFRKLMYEALAA